MSGFVIEPSQVLYLDNHLLILHKPPGIVVQSDNPEGPSVESAAKAFLKAKFNKPGNVFATPAHRLDQPVGGLVIVARTSKALARMNTMFAERRIAKIYLAAVEGKPEGEKHLRHWIKKNELTNKVWCYTYKRGDAKQADLYYWLTGKSRENSLLMVRLYTGRHHQIRAQLGLEKIPIVNDVKYGASDKQLDIALLSYAARFVHPVTGELITVSVKKADGIFGRFPLPGADELEMAFAKEI